MFQTFIFGILCNGCQLKCMSAFMGTIYLFIKNHYLFVTIIIQINVMCIILFFFFCQIKRSFIFLFFWFSANVFYRNTFWKMHSVGRLSNRIHSRSRVNEHNRNELALNHLSLMHACSNNSSRKSMESPI